MKRFTVIVLLFFGTCIAVAIWGGCSQGLIKF